ncbi:MAG: RNA polymerase sigma-70 factor [Pedobacter sp.]|uniref:RNA polymerase sigma factor n=1 Tax=Pedobacter sp. TaxID=1411316 RepID=UPI003565C19E
MDSYTKLSDNELTSLLKKGDQEAYTQLYKRYWPLLYLHARKMLKDDEEAMDVVQDIYTILWEKRTEISPDVSVKSYLYMAVRNHTLNRINRSKLKDKYLESLVDFINKGALSTEEEVCYRDFAERIEREVAAFSPKMKRIFEMSRNEGLSNRAIADELDITDHAVKKTINRALKVLRSQISSLLFSF